MFFSLWLYVVQVPKKLNEKTKANKKTEKIIEKPMVVQTWGCIRSILMQVLLC